MAFGVRRIEVIWHSAFRLVPYITSYSSRCRGISVKYFKTTYHAYNIYALCLFRQIGASLLGVTKSEFSKTEHAQKTPVPIANEGQRTGAVRISTNSHKNGRESWIC